MKLKVPFHSADASGFYVGQAATVTVNANMDGTVYFTALAAEVEAPDATAIEAAGNLSFMVSAGANTLTLPGCQRQP